MDDIVSDYGHLIVDECHHLSAVSFELVAKRTKARYVLRRSATVTRKDGHHPIIFMQCGSVRKRVNARTEAARRPFDHRVRIRHTAFRLPDSEANVATVPIQDVYRALAGDEGRNELIFNDVLAALEARRSPVVITERTDHLEALADRLSRFAKNVIVLRGGQRRSVRQALSRPMVETLHAYLVEKKAEFSPNHDLYKAINYLLKRWPAFTLFLEDGRVCMSNNAAERALRGIALGRKSWLFCGSDRGGQRAAAMYSLIVTCKMNGVDPHAWLADVLARIATHPAHRIDEFLRWCWKALREEAVTAEAA